MKQEKYTLDQLQNEIALLEYKLEIKKGLIQTELIAFKNNLSPIGILSSLLNLKFGSKNSNLQNRILGSITGVGLGFLGKGIVGGNKPGILSNLKGGLLQLAITKLVASNPAIVISMLGKISSLLKPSSSSNNDLIKSNHKPNAIYEDDGE